MRSTTKHTKTIIISYNGGMAYHYGKYKQQKIIILTDSKATIQSNLQATSATNKEVSNQELNWSGKEITFQWTTVPHRNHKVTNNWLNSDTTLRQSETNILPTVLRRSVLSCNEELATEYKPIHGTKIEKSQEGN